MDSIGCGKIPYQDKVSAVAAAVRIMNRHGGTRRAYRCNLCGAWHLTHQKPRSKAPHRISRYKPH